MEGNYITQEELQKLKVLCDFVFCERFHEITDFSIFKICFEHLFQKDELSLEDVYDYLVGMFKDTNIKRNYLSFTRLYDEYLNYKINNRANVNKDISLFFDKLMKSIIHIPVSENKISIGKDEGTNFSSKIYLNGEFFYISRLEVLCNNMQNIAGLKLVYNNTNKNVIEMYNNEKGLNKALDLRLTNIEYNYINNRNKEIKDSITHIFGTFDETITSIGFKCLSGKISHFGEQKGEPFLFGCFKGKIQYLNINIKENGIRKLESFFTHNEFFNKHLENDIDKIFSDEKFKDDENYDLYRKTRILKLGKYRRNKFQGEEINYNQTFAYLNNNRSSNKNYNMNPNPFLKIDFTDIVIPNPFFPKELAEKKKEFKGTQISVCIGYRKNLNDSIGYDLKIKKSSKSEGNAEKNKEKIKENLLKKLEEKLFNLEKKLQYEMNECLSKLCPNGIIKKDIQIAFNPILEYNKNMDEKYIEKEENEDGENIDNDKSENKFNDENKRNQDKIEGIKYICNELGLDSGNNEIEEKIFQVLNKENNDDNSKEKNSEENIERESNKKNEINEIKNYIKSVDDIQKEIERSIKNDKNEEGEKVVKNKEKKLNEKRKMKII